MGFGKIFWGLIFTMLNFRIGGFDILPNIVGYILIYNGLKEISYKNDFFKTASTYAFPLIFVSILEIYQFQNTIEGATIFHPIIFISFLVGIGALILNLILMYNLCMGISEMSREVNDLVLSERALKRWKYYLYVNIASFAFGLIALIVPILGLLMVLPLAIVNIIVMVLILSLVKTAQDTKI